MLANVVRQWTTPGSWYRSVWTTLGAQQQINYEGDRNDIDYHAYWQATFKNYMNFSFFGLFHPSYYDERLTRGGPTVIHYGYNLYSGGTPLKSWSESSAGRTRRRAILLYRRASFGESPMWVNLAGV